MIRSAECQNRFGYWYCCYRVSVTLELHVSHGISKLDAAYRGAPHAPGGISSSSSFKYHAPKNVINSCTDATAQVITKRTIARHSLLVVRLSVPQPVHTILYAIFKFVIKVLPARIRECTLGMQGGACSRAFELRFEYKGQETQTWIDCDDSTVFLSGLVP